MQVDFYQMGGRFDDPLTVTCILVGKAWPKVKEIAVVAQPEQLKALDEALWQMPEGRFLPHGQEAAPIRLLEKAPPTAELLINLDPASPLPEGTYDRVLEIVPATEDAREPLRERWRAWTARGAKLNHHALK